MQIAREKKISGIAAPLMRFYRVCLTRRLIYGRRREGALKLSSETPTRGMRASGIKRVPPPRPNFQFRRPLTLLAGKLLRGHPVHLNFWSGRASG